MGGFYMFNKASGMEGSPYGGPGNRSRERIMKQYSCNSCRFVRYLLSDGTLLPCISMTGSEIHKHMPNVRSRGLIEALRDPGLWEIVSIKVGDLLERNKECAECEHFGGCTLGCRTCALTYGEGVFAKDPFTCHYWKEGYPAKIEECIKAHTRN
jgi:radical SAM protein with 4Fe4S-binding SPASM domain